jgi:hypothetical protein
MSNMASWMKKKAAVAAKPMNAANYRMNAVRGLFGRKHIAMGAHQASNQVRLKECIRENGLELKRT